MFYVKTACVVVTLALATTTACTDSSDRKSNGAATPTSEMVTADVSPEAAFHLELPDGTTIDGPVGAAAEAGELTVTPSAMDVPADVPLPAGQISGFELTAPGGGLAKPVTVSFPAPDRDGVPRDALPVIVHVDGDGTWTYDPATKHGDRFEIVTKNFSFRAPDWLNPVEWIKWLLNAALNTVTGRTDQPSCKDSKISWASLEKKTSMLHTCLKSQPDKQGVARAEAFLKANRTVYMKVSAPTSVDYTWQQESDTLYDLAIKHARTWLSTDSAMLVPPGNELSVGYKQPQVDTDETISAYIDISTVLLSTAAPIIDLAAGVDDRGGLAALWALKACADKIPARMDDAGGWWKALACVFADAIPQLANDDKALAAARSLLGEAPKNYSVEGAAKLKAVSTKLKLLGKAFKVLGLGLMLRDAINEIIDGLGEGRSYQPGTVLMHLKAGPLTASQLRNSLIPAGSCNTGGETEWGWDRTVSVQLHDGQGETAVPGSDEWVSILESSLLGWNDFNDDGKRDAVLMLRCAGSRIDLCCAGQSSLLNFIAVFSVGEDGKLTRIGEPYAGQEIYPGDEYGPASSSVISASLVGKTLTTEEGVLYSHLYTYGQLGDIDPDHPIFTSSRTLTSDG